MSSTPRRILCWDRDASRSELVNSFLRVTVFPKGHYKLFLNDVVELVLV